MTRCEGVQQSVDHKKSSEETNNFALVIMDFSALEVEEAEKYQVPW